jgi:hypothetical protein
MKKPQALDDAVIEVDQLRFGELIDVDLHLPFPEALRYLCRPTPLQNEGWSRNSTAKNATPQSMLGTVSHFFVFERVPCLFMTPNVAFSRALQRVGCKAGLGSTSVLRSMADARS